MRIWAKTSCPTETLFSLQPHRAPAQSGHSFQWAGTGWREESIWQPVCRSPASKYFSWRRGEGEMRRLLPVPCGEGTRGIFTQVKFQGCDEWGSDTVVVTRHYQLLPFDFGIRILTKRSASTQCCRESALPSCFCSFCHNIACLSA